MRKFSLLGFFLVALSMFGGPAVAQTPDGQTPAEETVCDPLKADGITKGLYGLCVAFCEAQDFASVDIPISAAELEDLAGGAPSGKILNNYNKKKTESDPEMPCIVVEAATCPCWTADELATFDGIQRGVPVPDFRCRNFGTDPTGAETGLDIIEAGGLAGFELAYGGTAPTSSGGIDNACLVLLRDPTVFRFLSVAAGTLTTDEAAGCLASVQAQCDLNGL